MYPPPHNDVFAKLVGHSIDLVSVGKYVLHLSFDSGDKLSIAGPFRFDSRDRFPESLVQDFPLQVSNIFRAVGTVVHGVETEVDGTLRLDLDNGDTLIAYANDPAYEAYTLLVDGTEYVV